MEQSLPKWRQPKPQVHTWVHCFNPLPLLFQLMAWGRHKAIYRGLWDLQRTLEDKT